MVWDTAWGVVAEGKAMGAGMVDRIGVESGVPVAVGVYITKNRKGIGMKIVVTALGETIDSPVDQRFGRTRYFVAYDSESGEWSAHDNKPNMQAAQGAGIQAGQKVIELGGEVLLTGHCGPKAFSILSAGDVAVYNGATGTVKEAIAAFEAGKLQKAEGADVDSHNGL
jgi:predicted Fe-Mo cluster-binding NifX family protein